jgi:hypothetical protein
VVWVSVDVEVVDVVLVLVEVGRTISAKCVNWTRSG